VDRAAGLVSIVAACLLLGGCAAGLSALPPSPERPGTEVRIVNPDPQKWRAVELDSRPRPVVFVCKPPACAAESVVAAQIAPSTTRNPDRKTLERLAKLMPAQIRAQDVMMEAASDGSERMVPLSTRITAQRDFPAILSESKRTSRDKTTYAMRGDLFVGVVIVRMLSLGSNQDDVRRNFESFVNALGIIDVPPPATGGAASVALEAAEPTP
jgi:hypothetical protein